MNILITGGAGFIGSNFVRYILNHDLSFFNKQSDKLVVFDKLTYAGNKQNLENLPGDFKVEFVQGDLFNYEEISKCIDEQGIELIVHFAAETHVDRSILGPREFVNTNIVGTFNILEKVRKEKDGGREIRFHHISTDEVYGELPLNDPTAKFSEASNYEPRSPYSASKAASDLLVKSYISTYGINATISNCSNNYGPYCFPEKLIPLVITRALYGEEIPVYGDGMQVRDWIHTDDHSLGISLTLEKGTRGETYLFGGNGERTNIWMVKKILEFLEKPESLIVYVGDRRGHDRRYAVDFSKAEKQLGYSPQKPIEERLLETVEWYKNNRSWWEPLKPQADSIAEKYLSQRI